MDEDLHFGPAAEPAAQDSAEITAAQGLPERVVGVTYNFEAPWAATLGSEDPPAPGTLVKIVKVRTNP